MSANLACACSSCAPDQPLPDPASVAVAVGPAQFVACPDRGQHARITECWPCWSDVHQGRCDLAEALHPDHYDLLTLLEGNLGDPPTRPELRSVR